jgi:hypothetical protein
MPVISLHCRFALQAMISNIKQPKKQYVSQDVEIVCGVYIVKEVFRCDELYLEATLCSCLFCCYLIYYYKQRLHVAQTYVVNMC